MAAAEAAAAAGDVARAEQLYAGLLAQWPRHPALWFNLGNLQAQRGDDSAAAGSFGSAALHAPRFAAAFHNRGNALVRLGRGEEAAAAYRGALIAEPALVASRIALARLLADAGRGSEAAALLQQGLDAAPDDVPLLTERGRLHEAQGDAAAAMVLHERAYALAPGSAAAVHNLAAARHALGADGALPLAQQAVQLDPTLPEAHQLLGELLAQDGVLDAAATAYRQAAHQRRRRGGSGHGAELQAALLLPPVPGSHAELLQARARFAEGVQAALRAEGPVADPITEVALASQFYLAFHGLPNAGLLADLAALHRARCPALGFTAPHAHEPAAVAGRPLRVGIVSRYLRQHTVGRYLLRLVQRLARPEFHVSTFTWPHAPDDLSRAIAAAADAHHVLPLALHAAQQAVAAARLDVLVYGDIGMEPASYFLAFARLAPVQAAFYGHPDTTGLASIDHYISWQAAETAASQAWYREPLALLPADAMYACLPAPGPLPPHATRAEAGLPADGRLLLCVQSPFKIHPDFDELAAAVLALDREARLVLVGKSVPAWNAALQQRLARRLGPDAARLHFVPERPYADYLRLLSAVDVVLDTPHFCGGATSLDALAMGVPVVTQRGVVLRANQTAAMLDRLGTDELVADDAAGAVALAVALAHDGGRRHVLQRQLADAAPTLFEDDHMVRAFEAMLWRWAGSLRAA